MSLTADDMNAIDDLDGQFAPANQGIDENFEFDSSEFTEDDLDSGGKIEIEGFYHLEITKVEKKLSLLDENGKEQTPQISITCKALHSTPKMSPAGSAMWHNIYVGQKSGEPAKKGSVTAMLNFGLGCGLLTWGKREDGTSVPVLKSTGTTKVPINAWDATVGMQFVAFVKIIRAEGKEPRAEIPFGKCYRPDHPDVSHVAKNVEALEAVGIKINQQPTATEQKAKEAYKTATATGGPASGSAGKVEAPAKKTQEPVAAAASGGFSMDDL
jgi:hypothetical protein